MIIIFQDILPVVSSFYTQRPPQTVPMPTAAGGFNMDPGSISTDELESSRDTISAALPCDSFDTSDLERAAALALDYVSIPSPETVTPDQMTSLPMESNLQQIMENMPVSPLFPMLPPQPASADELLVPSSSTVVVTQPLETHGEFDLVSNSTVFGQIHTADALTSSVLIQYLPPPEQITSKDASSSIPLLQPPCVFFNAIIIDYLFLL